MSNLRLRTDGLHWLRADGEVVALDENSLVYLNANPTGALLWEELARGTTRDKLVRALMDDYEVDEATAAADVDVFLAELDGRGLLMRGRA